MLVWKPRYLSCLPTIHIWIQFVYFFGQNSAKIGWWTTENGKPKRVNHGNPRSNHSCLNLISFNSSPKVFNQNWKFRQGNFTALPFITTQLLSPPTMNFGWLGHQDHQITNGIFFGHILSSPSCTKESAIQMWNYIFFCWMSTMTSYMFRLQYFPIGNGSWINNMAYAKTFLGNLLYISLFQNTSPGAYHPYFAGWFTINDVVNQMP